jgi:hypothetical protein
MLPLAPAQLGQRRGGLAQCLSSSAWRLKCFPRHRTIVTSSPTRPKVDDRWSTVSCSHVQAAPRTLLMNSHMALSEEDAKVYGGEPVGTIP